MDDLSTRYRERGYAVLEGVVPAGQLDSIRSAAMRIVEEFDPDRHRTIFTTRNQEHAQDRYFLESAEAVHCFLEEEAVEMYAAAARAGNSFRVPGAAVLRSGGQSYVFVAREEGFVPVPVTVTRSMTRRAPCSRFDRARM